MPLVGPSQQHLSSAEGHPNLRPAEARRASGVHPKKTESRRRLTGLAHSFTDMPKKTDSDTNQSASQLIDGRIEELGDWRGKTLSRLRALIKQADPDVVEEWKWGGVPVWSHDRQMSSARR